MNRRASVGVVLLLVAAALSVVVPASPANAADPPTLSVGDVAVIEGDGGSIVVYVPVDLSVPSTTTVKVSYTVAGTTANGQDFSGGSGKLSFPAGVTTKKVRLVVSGDTNIEGDDAVAITLHSPVGATIERGTGLVTILDDDTDGVGSNLEVNVGAVTVVESDRGRHIISVPITLSRPAPTTIKVAFVGNCSTALPGTDFSGKQNGTVTFLAGQQSKFLNFQIVADFTPEELVEQFMQSVTVKLGPSVVVNQVTGGGVIVDNDTENSATQIGLALYEIRRVSEASDGTESDTMKSFCSTGRYPWGSLDSTISGNGRYTAFVSTANNLVPGDNNGEIDTFVHDNLTGETERVSVHSDGTEFTHDYWSVNPWQTSLDSPAITYDGRYVTFTDVYSGNIYVRDRVVDTTELITVLLDGSSVPNWPANDVSSISDDGRYVAFTSRVNFLVPFVKPDPVQHVWLRDRVGHTTQLIATLHFGSNGGWSFFRGPTISGNGRFIAFQDGDGTLVPGDTNGCVDVFVYDRTSATFEPVSVDSSENPQSNGCLDGSSMPPIVSSDGRYVGFSSMSRSLYGAGPTDPINFHSYIRDRATGTTMLVDDPSTVPTAAEDSVLTGMSDDARYITYECHACGDPLPATPAANDDALFWHDRQTGASYLVGTSAAGDPPTNEDTGGSTQTWGGDLSADGSVTAFETRATNLVAQDTNEAWDVFVQRMR